MRPAAVNFLMPASVAAEAGSQPMPQRPMMALASAISCSLTLPTRPPLDSTSNLVHRLHSLHLRLKLSGALPRALAEKDHGPGGREHVLWLHDYTEIEPALASLREAGCSIEELELEQPDLEDVFLEIMKRSEALAEAT